MIRFHSFYPWHKEQEYKWMEDEKDTKMLPWVLEFNKFDLYSKSDDLPDPEALRPYYQSLIDKYCPGKLRWSALRRIRHYPHDVAHVRGRYFLILDCSAPPARNNVSRQECLFKAFEKWVSSWQKDLRVVFILHVQVLTGDVLCDASPGYFPLYAAHPIHTSCVHISIKLWGYRIPRARPRRLFGRHGPPYKNRVPCAIAVISSA